MADVLGDEDGGGDDEDGAAVGAERDAEGDREPGHPPVDLVLHLAGVQHLWDGHRSAHRVSWTGYHVLKCPCLKVILKDLVLHFTAAQHFWDGNSCASRSMRKG